MFTVAACLALLVGWVLFIFSVVNVSRIAYEYAIQKDERYKCWSAAGHMILFAAAFAVWQYLVFYAFPALMALSNI